MMGRSQQKSFTTFLPSLQPYLPSALRDDVIVPPWDRHHSMHWEYRRNKPYSCPQESDILVKERDQQ